MESKNYFFNNVDDFLQNDKFIKWRLFQTKELDEYWTSFINDNPHLEKAFLKAISQFRDVRINHFPISDIEKKEVYSKIQTRIEQHNKRRRIVSFSCVAAVLLLGILSVFFIKETRKSTLGNIPENLDRIVGQTLPEEDIFILSKDKKIILTDKSHIGLKSDGKAIVTDSNQLAKEILLATSELNRLVVPYGKRTDLTLSDGTEICLNSGTQLDFPSEFNGKAREIFINGEMYIDVAEDTSTPFIVHAGNMEVTVLGTAFNISAYKDDHCKTVVLVNGKINIETDNNYKTILIPNEKIEITDNSITKEFVDVAEYVSWKDGFLKFNSTPMSDILKRVSRYYNVQFKNTDEVAINDKTFTGKLFLSKNLDSVMTSISAISSTDYVRKENKIILSKKKMPMK